MIAIVSMRSCALEDAAVGGDGRRLRQAVLVRADLNVPLEDGHVADDTRIRAALPTLRRLLEHEAAEVVVCSHLGRPSTDDDRRRLSIAPVAECLTTLLPDRRLRVLENTRFNPGETKNDPAFARELAQGMDLYVNDAFGSAHRAHASTEAVAHLLPAYAGLLLLAELRHLGKLLGDVERPFVIVAGGAKVEDKLAVLENLGGRSDTVLIGGKMAEQMRVENPLSFPVELPTNVVVASAFAADAETHVAGFDEVPEGWLGLDIGPETRDVSPGSSQRRRRSSGTAPWACSNGSRSRAVPRRRGGRGLCRRVQRRRRRRFRARDPGARAGGQDLVGLDGRRRVARAARGQGAPGVAAIPEA